MTNISKLYYKKYFEEIDFSYVLDNKPIAPVEIVDVIKGRNNNIIRATFSPIPPINAILTNCFSLKVAYPGLSTGMGINHEANITGEFKLGMHFNYSYGMPIIYGSSVKGALKNAFPAKEDSKVMRNAKIEMIQEYLGEKYKNINVEQLRDAIFEGKGSDNKNISIYKRDIFHDAVIEKAYESSNGCVFLATDSITPHGDNPLKDPIPITFLKIAPGVIMEFRFSLHKSKIDDIIVDAADKEMLFKAILLDFGIGAKTNVGYGQFEE